METAFRSEERFSREEFWEFLDALPPSLAGRWELLNGRIVVSPAAKWRHAAIGATLTTLLHRHVHDHGAGIVFDASMGFDLPTGDTVQPDVSFVTSERFRAQPPPKPRDKGFLRVIPSLVVEVLSFSTRKHDRTEKAKIYARSGIEEYWLVDPELRVVTVRMLVGERYIDEPSVVSGLIRSVVLPELELTIEDVFRAIDAVDPNR